jgi:hypothetical protein
VAHDDRWPGREGRAEVSSASWRMAARGVPRASNRHGGGVAIIRARRRVAARAIERDVAGCVGRVDTRRSPATGACAIRSTGRLEGERRGGEAVQEAGAGLGGIRSRAASTYGASSAWTQSQRRSVRCGRRRCRWA